jgi:hypothetical protein
MNPRAEKLILSAFEFKKHPPTSNMQIIHRSASILKIIYPDGSTFLSQNTDQEMINILSSYLGFVAKALNIQTAYENEVFVVKNLKDNFLQVLSELFEKEKMAHEIEKRVKLSYSAMINGLNIKLEKILHLLEQRPIELEMKKEAAPKVVEKEGEVEEKNHLQPGAG